MIAYLYGMKKSGFKPGAQPETGLIRSEADPLNEYEDMLLYSRRLASEEREKYGLDFVGERKI